MTGLARASIPVPGRGAPGLPLLLEAGRAARTTCRAGLSAVVVGDGAWTERTSYTRGSVPRLALTAMEAPAALGVSDDFFRDHIASELRWVRRGAKKLVSVRELEAWLERESARTLGEREDLR